MLMELFKIDWGDDRVKGCTGGCENYCTNYCTAGCRASCGNGCERVVF